MYGRDKAAKQRARSSIATGESPAYDDDGDEHPGSLCPRREREKAKGSAISCILDIYSDGILVLLKGNLTVQCRLLTLRNR